MTDPGRPARTQAEHGACRVMLCRRPAFGLVGLNVLVNGQPQRRRHPMCRDCADGVGDALQARRRPALTPDGNLYMDDLGELLRGLR